MGKEKVRALIVEDPRGDLFAYVFDLDECYFIPTGFSMGAFAGDIVLAHIKSATRKNDLRPRNSDGVSFGQYAVVDSIQEFGNFYYAGVCSDRDGELAFTPDCMDNADYNVFKTKKGGAQDGDRAVARISRKKFSREFRAGIEKAYGNADEIAPYIDAMSDSVRLNLGWTDDCGILLPVRSEKRKDLRTKVTVALSDGCSCCDRAYSMEQLGDDTVLYFHILDVDENVPIDSKLDLLVSPRLRFPEGFFGKRPLFSEQISESLEFKEGEDRNAVTVIATFGSNLELKSLYIEETVINLTMKASYEEIDIALKESDSSRLRDFHKRISEARDVVSLMFSFAGNVIASARTKNGFVGTCLAPRFILEYSRVVELAEKPLFDGELLEKCLLSALSCAIGETMYKNSCPVLYEGEWPLGESDLVRFSSYCRTPLNADDICSALAGFYNNCERGVYERTAYNEIYSRLCETFVSHKPVKNTLMNSNCSAVVDGPLTNYVGLTQLRLLKAAANKNIDGCADLAKSITAQYKAVMPLIYKTCRTLYRRTMFAYASSLPTPAEAIITAFERDRVTVSLVNGCIGYIYADGREKLIDVETKTLTVGNRTYSYGDYITIRSCDADERLDAVKFEPIV